MQSFLPFIISGIATGAVYGLAGTGLVLTYKTSGIFNFGHGAMATAAAYTFYWLHYSHGMPSGLALLLSVGVLGPAMGAAMERVAVRLANQRTAMQVVGTIGLALLVQGLATIRFGTQTLTSPRLHPWIPRGRSGFRVFDTVVTYEYVVVFVVSSVAVGLLYLLFRFSRMGVAMRAVVDDPDLLSAQGVNPAFIRRVAWIIGAVLASLSGVLVAPLIGVDSIVLTFLVVTAFGAAAIGAFSSIPLTFAGGLLIGVLADLSTKYVLSISWLSGLPDALPFVVLFIVLLALPRGRLVRPSQLERRPPLQYRAPGRVRLTTGVLVLVPLALVPNLVGTKLPFFIAGLCTAVMLLSLGLLVRVSGQVSLCHAAFAAIGAVAFSQLRVDHGVPWILALLLAGLVVVPVGAIVAIPAIRLSGLFLALATLGFGILVQRLFYGQSWMFTSLNTGRVVPRPDFAHGQHAWYYFVLAVFVVTSLVLTLIQRSRLGRMLNGMAEAPTAVAALGLTTSVSRILVFCVSSFFAGIAGVLYAATFGYAVSTDNFYIPFTSLILLAMLAIAPFAEPWYALVPAVGIVIPGYITGTHTSQWLNVVFGVSAVLIAMQGSHPPMSARLRAFLDRFASPRRPPRIAAVASALVPAAARSAGGTTGLVVRGLSVRFGGLVAVDGLSLEAPLGRTTGLIGPNGAGKTTTFDACSGLNRRYQGQVLLDGRDLSRSSPPARGRAGLGRTFQRMQLGDSLTVDQNVLLGSEASQAGANPLRQLAATGSTLEATRYRAAAAMELCGITALAQRQVGALSTGERRLVELARCLAGPFTMLLLDEPSSGLDTAESARFGVVLQQVVAERGIGILLVEHDMSLVMDICSYIYVLDFGRLIFEGGPGAVAANPEVRAAYLGAGLLVEAETP